MMKFKFDSFDGLCFFNGLVFFSPVALLVRTQAGVSVSAFFILQALLSGVIFLGEIPAGFLTDRIGYRKSLILAQILLLAARIFLLLAFLKHSFMLFVVEAIVEGIADCFFSGTDSAYLYCVYGKKDYLTKRAHAANYGTAGFIISTLVYVLIYKQFDMAGLLLATVMTGSAALICSLFLEENSVQAEEYDEIKVVENKSVIPMLFRQKKTFVLTLMLSVISLAWILINFFYADKLISCDIDVAWLSVIILIYSAIQLSGKYIIRKTETFDRDKLSLGFTIMAGAALIIFGFLNAKIAVIGFMIGIPLLLDLPEYTLNEQENEFVDSLGAEKHRASVFSVLNMGVNVVEIAALFASAALAAVGISQCFLLVGLVLTVGGAVLYRQKSKQLQ